MQYIDDLFVLALHTASFQFIEQVFYVSQPFEGIPGIYIPGIYPPSARIASTSQPLGITANYMDIHAYLQGGGTGPVMTSLYDKHGEPAFLARLQPIIIQDMSTCLSVSCNWNIFDAHFVRYTRIF